MFWNLKSLVSLSKLSLIADGDYDQREMDALNRKLDYLAYIENLPADVIKVDILDSLIIGSNNKVVGCTLKKLSLDVNRLPVFKPKDLLRVM